MDKRVLQLYSVWAKDNLEKQIEVSLKTLGINSDKDIKECKIIGDYAVIEGDATSYPKALDGLRKSIVNLVQAEGYENVIEEFAYTWFNRFVALRFMEIHDFLPHGFRVLSSRDGNIEPEILKNLNFVKDDLKLDLALCASLKEEGKIEELYRYVLFRQCNALSAVLPMLFSEESAYLELLLPQTLLKGETILTKLVEIPEEFFLNDVEVIGWLYQFYISVKKDEVFASKKTITKDTLPAVTQLFTPDWIVRYMADNSVGRIWLESYPNSSLKNEMKYYVPNPEQTEEVQRRIDAVKYRNVNPEDLKIIEPCCGSGHILVYVFDLLQKMYEEKGYQKREIPTLILKNNLYGLDVDKRAAQLAAFSLVMKARSVNPRFFSENYYVKPQVYEIWDSRLLYRLDYQTQLKDLNLLTATEMNDIEYIVDTFRYAKTIGSLLKVKALDWAKIDATIEKLQKQAIPTVFNFRLLGEGVSLLKKLVCQAKIMSAQYDVMITNPPYIGISAMETPVKDYAVHVYPNSKADMFAMFMETDFVKKNGFTAMINMHSWMFLSSFEKLRESILNTQEIVTMAHLGAHAFEAIGGEVVQTTSFAMRNVKLAGKGVYFRLVDSKDKEFDFVNALTTGGGITTDLFNVEKIPSKPFAYWVSKELISAYDKGDILSNIARATQGLATGDNGKFVRFWFEVSTHNLFLDCTSRKEAQFSKRKWFPYNKGGELRKWYGNNDCVVNWFNDGYEIRNNFDVSGRLASRPQNMDWYFKESITWSKISGGIIAFRYKPFGHIFDVAGTSIFASEHNNLLYLLALNNSNVIMEVLRAISPTINYEVGQIASLPIIRNSKFFVEVSQISKENIELSKKEWDSFETSWDFKKHPLI